MKRKFFRYFSLISLMAAVFGNGCVTMTEAEREEREYQRVEWRQQFVVDRANCASRGGRFVFDGSAEQDRNGVPKYRVMYICARPAVASLN